MLDRARRALPPYVHTVTARGREYFYFQIGRGGPAPGPRVRLRDPWSPTEIAEAIAASGDKKWDGTLGAAVKAAAARAATGSFAFAIDLPFVKALAERQGFRCAVSGIQFESGGYTDCRSQPFMPSIDRIDPSHGYVKDNVRIVCLIANYAMSDWGPAALDRLADAIVRNRTGPSL